MDHAEAARRPTALHGAGLHSPRNGHHRLLPVFRAQVDLPHQHGRSGPLLRSPGRQGTVAREGPPVRIRAPLLAKQTQSAGCTTARQTGNRDAARDAGVLSAGSGQGPADIHDAESRPRTSGGCRQDGNGTLTHGREGAAPIRKYREHRRQIGHLADPVPANLRRLPTTCLGARSD